MSYNELVKEFERKMEVTDYIQAQIHHGESGGVEYVKKLIDCSDEIAVKILDEYGKFNQLSQTEIARVNSQTTINIPHCPTCNSTNISRISTTAKVINVAMFGLLGQKRKHQFKCNDCKYEW